MSKNYFQNSLRSVIFSLHNFHEAQLFPSIFPVSVYVCVASSSFQTPEFFMECKLKSFSQLFRCRPHSRSTEEFIEEWNWYLFSFARGAHENPWKNPPPKPMPWRRWRRMTRRQMPNGWMSWENFRLIYLGKNWACRAAGRWGARNERKIFRSFPSLYAAVYAMYAMLTQDDIMFSV